MIIKNIRDHLEEGEPAHPPAKQTQQPPPKQTQKPKETARVEPVEVKMGIEERLGELKDQGNGAFKKQEY